MKPSLASEMAQNLKTRTRHPVVDWTEQGLFKLDWADLGCTDLEWTGNEVLERKAQRHNGPNPLKADQMERSSG